MLLVLCVSFCIRFHLLCVLIFSKVHVAELPPFGKELLIPLTQGIS